MQGMRKRVGGKHDTYTTKFSTIASMSDGQLVTLYNDMISLMQAQDLALVDKAYQASEIYIQMLRVIYTVDRVHDMHKTFWFQNVDGLDYTSGVAHPDPHLFLRQVKIWDRYITLRNQNYIEKKDIQKVDANPTITRQLVRWISRNHEASQYTDSAYALTSTQLKELAESIRMAQTDAQVKALKQSLKAEQTDTQIKALEHSVRVAQTSSDRLQHLQEDWANIFTLMSDHLAPLLSIRSEDNIVVSTAECSRLQGLIQKRYAAQTEALESDNDFARHFAHVMDYRPLHNTLSQIHEKVMASFADIGTVPEHAKYTPSYLELYSSTPVAPEILHTDTTPEHVIFEQSLLPFLAHMQYQALKENFAEKREIIGMNALLLASFIQGEHVTYPTGLHALQMQMLDSTMQDPQFLDDTLYALYQDLYNHATKETLQQMSTYYRSPGFISAHRWLREYGELHAAHGNQNESKRFNILYWYTQGVIASISILQSKQTLQTREQFDDRMRMLIGAYIPDLQQTPITGDSPNLGAYSKASFSSLVALDRAAYYTTKPLGELESAELMLRHHEGFIGLPSPLKAKIICEYVLFDGQVYWPEQTQVLNHLFQSLSAANAYGEQSHAALTQPYQQEIVAVRRWFSQTTNTQVSVFDHHAIFSILANKQHSALVKLLRHGVHLDIKNEAGLTPLQEATRLDDVAAVMRIMHAMQQRPDFYKNPDVCRLPTTLAVQHNSARVLQFYIEVIGLEAMRPTLLHEAVQLGHIEAVSVLRKAGFSPMALDSQGKIPEQYLQPGQTALQDALKQDTVVSVTELPAEPQSFLQRSQRDKARFFASGKGTALWYRWFKRSNLSIGVLAVTFLFFSFVFPSSLMFNTTIILSYASLVMYAASIYIILPTTSKVEELVADAGAQCGEALATQTARINPALLYTFDRSQDAIKLPNTADKSVSSRSLQATVSDTGVVGTSMESSSSSLGLVK